MLPSVFSLHPLPVDAYLYTSGGIASLLYLVLVFFCIFACFSWCSMPLLLKVVFLLFVSPLSTSCTSSLPCSVYNIICPIMLLSGPPLTTAFKCMLAFPDPLPSFPLYFSPYLSISLLVPLNSSTYTPFYTLTWTIFFCQLSLSHSSSIQIILKWFQLLLYITVRLPFVLELFLFFSGHTKVWRTFHCNSAWCLSGFYWASCSKCTSIRHIWSGCGCCQQGVSCRECRGKNFMNLFFISSELKVERWHHFRPPCPSMVFNACPFLQAVFTNIYLNVSVWDGLFS